jgi:hypothetical protein
VAGFNPIQVLQFIASDFYGAAIGAKYKGINKEPMDLDSVRSPRIVDYETPGAVCLATQNIRILGRELHGFTARSGSSEGPIADDEGQITYLEDPAYLEIEFAVHGDQAA